MINYFNLSIIVIRTQYNYDLHLHRLRVDLEPFLELGTFSFLTPFYLCIYLHESLLRNLSFSETMNSSDIL